MEKRAQKDIVVDISYQCSDVQADKAGFAELVKYICARFGVSRAAVSVAVVDDSAISKVNEEYLGHNHATDVISFDLSDEADGLRTFEIIVNGRMAERQAELRCHSVRSEVALYITHGLLHNLGFDDQNQADEQKMHNTEDEILNELGYGRVYRSEVK